MSIAVISHPDCVKHAMGEQHPEQPLRVVVVQEALQAFPFTQAPVYYQAQPVTEKQLLRVHPKHYVSWLQANVPAEGLFEIDEDTRMNPDSLQAAYLSAGSLPQAVDLVMQGKHQAVFCCVRPPGHHAEKDRAMGFCFFNNIALGVMHAIEEYGLSRVVIVDFDVHHGNGTQDIFQDDDRVMLFSSFEHPLYPGYDPDDDNAHIINTPIPAGSDGAAYRAAVADWFAAIDAFKPELIFISAGFDAHVSDPLANLALVKDDYVWITSELHKLAAKHCKGNIISALEGGYNLDALAECVPAHVNALVN